MNKPTNYGINPIFYLL